MALKEPAFQLFVFAVHHCAWGLSVSVCLSSVTPRLCLLPCLSCRERSCWWPWPVLYKRRDVRPSGPRKEKGRVSSHSATSALFAAPFFSRRSSAPRALSPLLSSNPNSDSSCFRVWVALAPGAAVPTDVPLCSPWSFSCTGRRCTHRCPVVLPLVLPSGRRPLCGCLEDDVTFSAFRLRPWAFLA